MSTLERALVAIGERAATLARRKRHAVARRVAVVSPVTAASQTSAHTLQHVRETVAVDASLANSTSAAVRAVRVLGTAADALASTTAQLQLQARVGNSDAATAMHTSFAPCCTCDGGSDVRNMHERMLAAACAYPRTLAAEVAAVLLEAGRADDALRVLRAWRGDNDDNSDKARRLCRRRGAVAVSRRLRRATRTLCTLRDAATLRDVLRLVARTHQQLGAHGTKKNNSSNGNAADTPCSVLLASLGRGRVRRLHTHLVASLCTLDERDGVSVHEQLTALDGALLVLPRQHAADDDDARGGGAVAQVEVLPPSLCAVYTTHIAPRVRHGSIRVQHVSTRLHKALHDEEQLQQRCYDDMLTVLALPRDERNALRRCWSAITWLTQTCALPLSSSSGLHNDNNSSSNNSSSSSDQATWSSLCAHYLPHSLPLQRMRDTACLLTTLLDKRSSNNNNKEGNSNIAAAREVARRAVVTRLLQSPHVSVRQHACVWLLRRRAHALWRLRLSLRAVVCTYAHTAVAGVAATTMATRQQRVLPVDVCVRLVCALARRQEGGDVLHAARFAWLQLGCNSTATTRRRRPSQYAQDALSSRALDTLVVCMCRALQTERTQGGGASPAYMTWAAHCTLVVLHRLATTATTTTASSSSATPAAPASSLLTPMHCIPVCAWAYDCGVAPHIVHGFVQDVLAVHDTDNKSSSSTITQTSALQQWTMEMAALCAEHTTTTATMTRNGDDDNNKSTHAVALCAVPRRRQLALWRLLRLQLPPLPPPQFTRRRATTTTTHTTSSPVLCALLALLFLDAQARRDVRLCNHWTTSSSSSSHDGSRGKKVTAPAEDVRGACARGQCARNDAVDEAAARAARQYAVAYDTLAALASSCGDERAYTTVLSALRRARVRHATVADGAATAAPPTTTTRRSGTATRIDCLAASEGYDTHGTHTRAVVYAGTM